MLTSAEFEQKTIHFLIHFSISKKSSIWFLQWVKLYLIKIKKYILRRKRYFENFGISFFEKKILGTRIFFAIFPKNHDLINQWNRDFSLWLEERTFFSTFLMWWKIGVRIEENHGLWVNFWKKIRKMFEKR